MPSAAEIPAHDLSARRILVTGGAGFIGSALVWELNRRGARHILITDQLGTSEKWRNLTPLRFEDYLEAEDLLPRLENGSLGKFDWVLHMGACSATTERDAAYLVRNNYEYTKQLCEWSLRAGARFVYASSAATYGDGAAGMSDQETDLGRFHPLNMYGYSKQMFDLYAQQRGWLNRVVGLKYFNIYGPNETHKEDMRSVVNKAFTQVGETGRIQLFKSYRPDYGDGEQKRDFLYVKDAVAMTLHLAQTSGAHGLFNVGSGQARTWNQLAHAVFSAFDLPARIEYVEMPELLRRNYQYFTQADISKLRATGFKQPVASLEAAVADYVRNYLQKGRHLGQEIQASA